ncbi:MAG TPA: YaaA family protein [Candidatus Saccharimonadales bacterium]
MITILTPSKTMDFASPAPIFAEATEPLFKSEADELRLVLAGYSTARIVKLMNVSQALAEKTQAMFADSAVKQAFWAYDGDVFKGVQAKTMNAEDATFAQKHVLVPSGMYGLVRPFDMISPYRLEMKAKLAIKPGKNLYDFWGDKIGRYVDTHANGEVLMLSSYEYARTIIPYADDATRIVTPAFIDTKPKGKEEQVAIYNKMMRGVMGRWVIDNRIDSLDDITQFEAHGYTYSPERSTDLKPVFYRQVMKPLIF